MTFVYIAIAVFVGWWLLKQFAARTPENRIEKLEEISETMLGIYRTMNKVSYGQNEDDPEVLRMKDWYIRLKEKYKHEMPRLLQIAEDWKDYTYSIQSKNTNHYLSLEAEDKEEGNERSDKAREAYLRTEEIENRFADLLGSQFREELEAARKKRREEIEAFWTGPIEK